MQKILIYLLLTAAIAGCAHKIDIQQGNVISEEQLSRLTIGMEQQQVKQIMGSPILTDPFHQQRWDYLYNMKPGRDPRVTYRATLYFSNNRLTRIEKEGKIPQKDQPKLDEDDLKY